MYSSSKLDTNIKIKKKKKFFFNRHKKKSNFNYTHYTHSTLFNISFLLFILFLYFICLNTSIKYKNLNIRIKKNRNKIVYSWCRECIVGHFAQNQFSPI